jgi:hypothetical protein
MKKTKWKGFLSYKAKHSDIDSVLKGSFVEVSYFSVKGGAKRIIDLTATDDLSLVSEFEQARSFKNISLYLPPTRDFEWHHLYEISHHGLPLSMAFFTAGNVGKTPTRQFTLTCENASISEQPAKKSNGGKDVVLMVNMSLPETKLVHGSLRHDGEFVQEDW